MTKENMTEQECLDVVKGLTAQIEQSAKDITQTHKDKFDKTKKLRKQLEDLSKPLEIKIDTIEKHQRNLYDERNEAIKKHRTLSRQNEIDRAEKKGEHNLSSFKEWIISKEIARDAGYVEMTHKCDMNNGLKCFRVFEECSKLRFFVFRGMDLVAFWTKEQEQHRGDDVESYSWVDTHNMNNDNELSNLMRHKHQKKEGQYGISHRENTFFRKSQSRYCSGHTHPTYAQFKNYVQELDAKKLKVIKMIGSNVNVLRSW